MNKYLKSLLSKISFILPNPLFKFLTYLLLYLKFFAIIYLSDSLPIHKSKLTYILYWLIWTLFISILISISNLFKRKTAIIYLFGINLIFTIVIIFDLWCYRSFSNFVSLYMTKQSANLDNTWTAIFAMFRPVDILFFIDIFVIIPILFKRLKSKNSDKRSIIGFLIFALTSIAGLYIGNEAMIKYREEPLFKICWTPNLTMYKLSPIGFHFMDAYEFFFESKTMQLSNQEKQEINNFLKQNIETKPLNEYYGFAKNKNLLVIQVESLENFVINKKINNQEITPSLNKLLERSYYFPNLIEQTNLGGSSDADFMVNTSILPLKTGSTFIRFQDNTYNSLPIILKKNYYFTQAIKSDKPSYYNWYAGLKALGFEKLYSKTDFKWDQLFLSGLSDSSLLFQSVKFIENAKQPFYTFLVTISSHTPFIIPDNQKNLVFSSPIMGTKLEDYIHSIHYTDKQIGLFLDELEKRGILKNTLVVIYGDHTGVHKFFGDVVKEIRPSENWWANQEYKLPLIIYSSDIKNPKKFEIYGGQIDVGPTILYSLGIEPITFQKFMLGKILFNTNKYYSFNYKNDLFGNNNNEDKIYSRKMLDISDKIIKSGYFGIYTKDTK